MRHLQGTLTLAQALLVFGPAIPALLVAGIVGNFGIYLIPPAKRAMDAEDRNYPGTEYKSAQRALSRVLRLIAPGTLVLTLAGAWWL